MYPSCAANTAVHSTCIAQGESRSKRAHGDGLQRPARRSNDAIRPSCRRPKNSATRDTRGGRRVSVRALIQAPHAAASVTALPHFAIHQRPPVRRSYASDASRAALSVRPRSSLQQPMWAALQSDGDGASAASRESDKNRRRYRSSDIVSARMSGAGPSIDSQTLDIRCMNRWNDGHCSGVGC